ncbi:hypothetical protein JWJ88_17145 [Paracoccus methylovorus]|uniref:Uncharacterized protein n=1 Tax=Paracoccus methylovorus TaxID=2812658 RepID=A0ABX7JL46_9RHOB|nr:hypothetical protein [Paracoccus methylovorus]QRZ14690.1 hypothetical protein JWJ88_17145 [Paracoccus methylovorus]
MIVQSECANYYGYGRLHSAGRNGDPMDNGADCHVCGGSGVVDINPADEIEDWMEVEDE